MQPPRDEQQSPPWPSGEVLAELDRPGFRGRPDRRQQRAERRERPWRSPDVPPVNMGNFDEFDRS